jgi:hypothetical protein
MRGRRRDQRFTLSVPWEGTLRVPADVVIEQYSETEKEVSVVSTAPAHRDELLTLDARGTDSDPGVTMSVRVTESVPVLIDGVVRHRLRLAIVD